jgi:hypothetical protein
VDADGGLTIEDLGSTNGTFVGGMRITEPRWLNPGDELRMGQTTLEVEAVAAEPPAWEPDAERDAEDAEPEATEPEAPEPEATPDDDARSKADNIRPESTTHPEPKAAEDSAPPVPPVTPPVVDAVQPPQTAPPAEAAAAAEAAPAGAAEAAPRPGSVPRPLVAVLVGVFVLAALGIGAVLLFTGDDEEDAPEETPAAQQVVGPPALVTAATAAGCTAQNPPIEGRQHVRGDVDYRSNPPTSGPHHERAAADGAWEVSPPVPALVHSLEHGRIVMWHRKGDEDAMKALRKVGNEDSSKMILTPNTTEMPYRIAASAWGHLLGCNELNDESLDAVRAFRDAYRGKGPELVP